jgi:ribosomal protein L35AE/L33A
MVYSSVFVAGISVSAHTSKNIIHCKCFIIKASEKKSKKTKKYFVGEKKVCIFAPRFSGNINRHVQKSSESRSLGGKPVDL